MNEDFEPVEGPRGPFCIRSRMFAEKGFIAAFTIRKGGWSPSSFDGLNMGFGVSDNRANVTANRQIALKHLGLDPDRAFSMRQVHGVHIEEAGFSDEKSASLGTERDFEATDGLHTAVKGAALVATTADCVPVIIADTENGRIGVAHAGWRGTAGNISEKLMRAMGFEWGRRGAFMAAIGPGIGPCCYEIGEDVAAAIAASLPKSQSALSQEGRIRRADLGLANELQLLSLGLEGASITRYKGCTSCEEDLFFSHRRDSGRTGRMAAIAASLR